MFRYIYIYIYGVIFEPDVHTLYLRGCAVERLGYNYAYLRAHLSRRWTPRMEKEDWLCFFELSCWVVELLLAGRSVAHNQIKTSRTTSVQPPSPPLLLLSCSSRARCPR